MSPRLKKVVAFTIIAATFAAFTIYLRANPTVVAQLRDIAPLTAFGLTMLYLLTVPIMALILAANLALCRTEQLPKGENLLLTSYSAIANFFGPLQSGPGVRAVYLKQKHGVSLKQFALASLIYYAMLGGLSLFSLLLAGGYIVLAAVGVVIALVLFAIARQKMPMLRQTGVLLLLLFVTAIQVVIMAVIYYAELRSVSQDVSFVQAIAYAGFANLSLFVSLTPGALGIREALLLLTEQIHQVNQATVIAASVLDRAVYLLYLGVLFIFSLVFGARAQLLRPTSVASEARSGQPKTD